MERPGPGHLGGGVGRSAPPEASRAFPWAHVAGYLTWVCLLAFFFAMVEIQVEGAQGWAAGLPTWRIESHWLLDIFWGGRPMTGYHAWVFSFMFLFFHLPAFWAWQWNLRLEARILGSVMVFWIVEDFLWFLFNPAYGWARFSPAEIPWHKSWTFHLPTDYVTFTVVGGAMLFFSFRPARPPVTPLEPSGRSAPEDPLPG